MSHENHVRDEGLRSLVVELERRRRRIARAQQSFATIADAYSLVLADLKSASGRKSDPAPSGGEATTTA
jgi:hypothetical protein